MLRGSKKREDTSLKASGEWFQTGEGKLRGKKKLFLRERKIKGGGGKEEGENEEKKKEKRKTLHICILFIF